MEFKTYRPATWMGRPGQVAETAKMPSQRWILHRWADTGETSLRQVTGDGRKPATFVEHQSIDLGTTATMADAVAAAMAAI